MKRIAAVLVLALAASSDPSQRTAFHVRCVEELDGARKTLYETTIEGPPGTDFTIVMRDPRFEMEASFLNEIVAERELDVRVKLESRRRYGVSRNKLPLWEVDRQQHRLSVAHGDQIELLPFGGPGSGGLLKIEIVPQRGTGSGPMTIDLGAHDLGGAITVQASHAPHWFDVDATLEKNGQVIARERAQLFYGSRGRVAGVDITAESFPYLDRWAAASVKLERDGRTSSGVVFFDRTSSFAIDGMTMKIVMHPRRTQ